MKNFDIVLFNLPTTGWYKKKFSKSNSMPPLGLLYIATALEENGYAVKVIDFAVENFKKDELINLLRELNPKVIGMSTYNESWNAQKMLTKLAKDTLPNVKIFSGGAFSSFCYEDVLYKSDTDYIITGEGEYSSLKLCNSIINNDLENISMIPGIVFKHNNKIIKNDCNRINDLDGIKFPNRKLVSLDKYVLPFTISTSRGCPGDCIFCSSRAFWGKKVKMRSAINIFNEVMYLHKEFGTTFFYITDDTFTASYKRAVEFCNMIKDTNIKFVWGCESRADIINEKLIKLLSENGCKKIQFGMESADNDILKKLKKHVTIEQIEESVRLANKYDMHISVSFIIGHAFDTKDTVEKTINFARYLQSEYGVYVMGSVNTPFPGTEQYDKSEELNIKIYSSDWNQYKLDNPIISTKNLSLEDLRYYQKKVVNIMSNNSNSFNFENNDEENCTYEYSF